MLVVPANRSINGQQILVVDPQTGQFLSPGVQIDLDAVDFDKKMHYMRALEQGDLVEYVPALSPDTKPSSKGVDN